MFATFKLSLNAACKLKEPLAEPETTIFFGKFSPGVKAFKVESHFGLPP